MLSKTDFRILSTLTSSQNDKAPLNVEALAKKLEVTAAFVSQRLRRLERDGFVERRSAVDKGSRVVHYFPRSAFSVQWVSPEKGIALEWQARADVTDWSFPLVTQVPDQDARSTLTSLLARLRAADLLDARTERTWLKGAQREFHGLSIILFGSAARGDARPGADVDLLFVHSDATPGNARQALDLAAEVSLTAPRPIQARDLNVSQFLSLPQRIRDGLRRDGIIVYDGLRTKPRGQTLQLWKYVYGGRALARP